VKWITYNELRDGERLGHSNCSLRRAPRAAINRRDGDGGRTASVVTRSCYLVSRVAGVAGAAGAARVAGAARAARVSRAARVARASRTARVASSRIRRPRSRARSYSCVASCACVFERLRLHLSVSESLTKKFRKGLPE